MKIQQITMKANAIYSWKKLITVEIVKILPDIYMKELHKISFLAHKIL